MILQALTEARSPLFSPIKYSFFPPSGLATCLPAHWEVEFVNKFVKNLNWNDEPNLVVIQVYITNAYRAYEIADHFRAREVYICLGGLHVTSLPDKAVQHANTIFIGAGEDT